MWSYTLYKQRTSFTCYENPCVICPWTSFSKRNLTLERGILSFSHGAYYQSRIFTCAFNTKPRGVIIPAIYCRVPANNNSDVIWLAYAITNCKGYQKDALSIQQGVIPSQLIIDTPIQHLNNRGLNVICSLNRLVPSWRRGCPYKDGFCKKWFKSFDVRRQLKLKSNWTKWCLTSLPAYLLFVARRTIVQRIHNKINASFIPIPRDRDIFYIKLPRTFRIHFFAMDKEEASVW